MKPYYLRFPDAATGFASLKSAGMIRTRTLYESVQVGTEPVTYWTLKADGVEERYSHQGMLLKDAMELLPESALPTIDLFDDALLTYLKDKGIVTEEVVEEPVYESRQIGEEDYPADSGLDVIGDAWRTVGTGKDAVTMKRTGWFANWIGEELPEGLEAYLVTPDPEYPMRIFAGHPPELMKVRDDLEAEKAGIELQARLEREKAITDSLIADSLLNDTPK